MVLGTWVVGLREIGSSKEMAGVECIFCTLYVLCMQCDTVILM
jgi:hypothetical protein